ncbi:SRPBCC family protein [Azospirillum halopraeferens]|uniref:SRPBCC family protein n=1 Tax=Azospirillum halopraeferens TaxID=34010 RepID=UPI00040408E5|nr:carbon monoxide dehydrogenase subunit G [Azospirillum halopraeferens]
MEMTGQYRIAAPRERVWEALNDPEVLRRCIPGCEEIDKRSDTEYTARVQAKVGPVSARFSGKVTLSDLDPPNGCTMTGEGTGGAAGFARGSARVRLAEEGDATVLSYTADAKVGGKLAQVGSRLIQSASRKMADDFFARFAEVVGDGAPAADPAGSEVVAGRAEPPPELPVPVPAASGAIATYLPWGVAGIGVLLLFLLWLAA